MSHTHYVILYHGKAREAGRFPRFFGLSSTPGIGTASRRVGVRAGGFLYFGLPHGRRKAVERLFKAGFDVQLRLSPYIPENVDTGRINAVECDRMLVEFLRVNSFILRLFPVDLSEYSLKQGNYRHLPLERKKRLLAGFTGKEITVCEDVPEHYAFWRDYFNPNREDCCNLKGVDNGKRVSADETRRPCAV